MGMRRVRGGMKRQHNQHSAFRVQGSSFHEDCCFCSTWVHGALSSRIRAAFDRLREQVTMHDQ